MTYSNSGNAIGIVCLLIVNFLILWIILSLVLLWFHPVFFTETDSVNWGVTAWVTIIIVIIAAIVSAIIWWIRCAIGHGDRKMVGKEIVIDQAYAPYMEKKMSW